MKYNEKETNFFDLKIPGMLVFKKNDSEAVFPGNHRNFKIMIILNIF